MYLLYDISVRILAVVLAFISIFNKKINLFVKGRRHTFSLLESAIGQNDKSIWFHCASLGEFEQGRPLLEQISKEHPEYKIILSFFSPSGYEVQKNYSLADVVVYLPLDTKKNAKRFLELTRVELAVFVKYEFWPNLLREIQKKEISAILISAIFRKDQIFFKAYGSLMRNALKGFDHLFVQNQESYELLKSIDITQVTVSGDTRFDRVRAILHQDNRVDFLEEFTMNKTVLVAGSTWPKDEDILSRFILSSQHDDTVYIIAPHQMDHDRLKNLKNKLGSTCALLSMSSPDHTTKVLIVDTVGLLTKIYSYADVAYVGGGFNREGVHNVLEPAVFGVPIVIGPEYKKYQEVVDLVNIKGCLVARDILGFEMQLKKLLSDESFRTTTGKICSDFIEESTGATQTILNYVNKKL